MRGDDDLAQHVALAERVERELRRRRRPDLDSRVRKVMLHGRMRQPEAACGSLLRPGDEDRGDHDDLAVIGALGGVGGPSRHALRSQSDGSGGTGRRIVI